MKVLWLKWKKLQNDTFVIFDNQLVGIAKKDSEELAVIKHEVELLNRKIDELPIYKRNFYLTVIQMRV